MPKAAPFNPLRLFSPIQLAFCMLLFFLPWIEMQCVMSAEEFKKMPKEQVEQAKKFGIDPSKPVSVFSQSGLQIATGGVSLGSDMKNLQDSLKKAGMKEDKKDSKKDEDVKGAPLMFMFPVALIAGIVVAFLPIPGMARRIALAGCCAAALGFVGIQALIGFPLENEIKKKSDEMKGMGGMGMGGGGRGTGGGDSEGKAKSESKPSEEVRVSWKFSLYLTLLLLLGAGGTAFLDGLGGGGRYKSKRKTYGRSDDDDEDEPPRKKKRRRDEEDDEDEDDRPKNKKALSLDDDDEEEAPPPPKKAKPAESGGASDNPFEFDDDEPPKKKKRRDEDDDDEPPRKKRR